MIRSLFCALITVMLFTFGGCSRGQSLNAVEVEFVHPDGTTSGPVALEVASTDSERMKGLMFRREMGKDQGMIFIFPKTEVHSFWMRNTYLPLDMIFLDDSFSVLGVLDHVPPLNELPRSIGKPGRYVIELNAGRAAELKIVPGTKAKPGSTLPKGA